MKSSKKPDGVAPNNFKQNSKICKIKSNSLLLLLLTPRRFILQNLSLNPLSEKVIISMLGKMEKIFCRLFLQIAGTKNI